jgi:hypothetical protein
MRRLLVRVVDRLVAIFTTRNEKMIFSPKLASILGEQQLVPLDVRRFAQFRVAWEAADIYNRYLYKAEFFESPFEHVREMAARASKFGDGLVLEFGVASGRTIRAIATAVPRVTGFDSFEGLPEDWRENARAGAFKCDVPEVPPNVQIKVGMIEETLPKFLESTSQPVTFMHIDTDLYGPAKFVLEACKPRINRAIVVFDEFFNYPGWVEHEYKAFNEFLQENPEFRATYLGVGGAAAVSVLLERK